MTFWCFGHCAFIPTNAADDSQDRESHFEWELVILRVLYRGFAQLVIFVGIMDSNGTYDCWEF